MRAICRFLGATGVGKSASTSFDRLRTNGCGVIGNVRFPPKADIEELETAIGYAESAMHEMRNFLVIATRHLNQPVRSKLSLEPRAGEPVGPRRSRSASTFTMFDNLLWGADYFRGELPLESDLLERHVRDASWGTCGPISYDDIAHVLIPRFFTQEYRGQIQSDDRDKPIPTWNQWEHEQDIGGLSKLLDQATIGHNLTKEVLEIKRF